MELTNQLCELVEESKRVETQERPHNGEMPLLVGKYIQHTFEDEVYNGKVLSVVPGFYKWYNVKYTDDPAIYVYQLQEDYSKGNLEIVVGRYTDVSKFLLLFILWQKVNEGLVILYLYGLY